MSSRSAASSSVHFFLLRGSGPVLDFETRASPRRLSARGRRPPVRDARAAPVDLRKDLYDIDDALYGAEVRQVHEDGFVRTGQPFAFLGAFGFIGDRGVDIAVDEVGTTSMRG